MWETGAGPVGTGTAPIDAMTTVGVTTIISVPGEGTTITVALVTGLALVLVATVTVATADHQQLVLVPGLVLGTGLVGTAGSRTVPW